MAAHDTLSALFPSQAADLEEALAEDLEDIPGSRAEVNGVALGGLAAAATLAWRARDGAQHAEPRVGVDFITSDDPGKWRQDPLSVLPVALGALWGDVTPFVLRSGAQFRVPPPPFLDSSEYAAAPSTR